MKSFLFRSAAELIADVAANKDLGYVVFANTGIVSELAVNIPGNVILCSTSGEFTPEGYGDKGVTGFTYDRSMVEVVEITYPPVNCLRELKAAYQKVRNNHNAFALLLNDGLSAMEEGIVTTFFFTDPDFKIIGGSAGDSLAFKETLIYIGQRKVHSVALFVNSNTKTQILKENLYLPIDKKMLVTDADPVKRIVRTFNNKPASTEYAATLGVPEGELSKYFMSNPLGRSLDGDIFIASPMKVNPDKSITFYSQIIPNTFVDILELGDYGQVSADTKNRVKIRPSFVLSINCILRSLYFIESGKWKQVNSELLSVCKNQTGFISYGEQYYRNHFNQTMVMLLVE